MTPEQAYNHALVVIKGRWPEGESIIIQSPYYSRAYAEYIIGGRWPEGEATIAKSAVSSYWYAKSIGHRFRLGEAAIAKDAQHAFWYARDVLNCRWYQAESVILQSQIAGYYLESFRVCKEKENINWAVEGF